MQSGMYIWLYFGIIFMILVGCCFVNWIWNSFCKKRFYPNISRKYVNKSDKNRIINPDKMYKNYIKYQKRYQNNIHNEIRLYMNKYHNTNYYESIKDVINLYLDDYLMDYNQNWNSFHYVCMNYKLNKLQTIMAIHYCVLNETDNNVDIVINT